MERGKTLRIRKEKKYKAKAAESPFSWNTVIALGKDYFPNTFDGAFNLTFDEGEGGGGGIDSIFPLIICKNNRKSKFWDFLFCY